MSDRTHTILVLATGGTIGMRSGERGLEPDPAFGDALHDMLERALEQSQGGLLRLVPRERIGFRTHDLSPATDSANADAATGPRIADALERLAREEDRRPVGAIVLHGTDTMAHVASRVAFELGGAPSPTIFTGSQLPYLAEGSDAFANLLCAVDAVLDGALEVRVERHAGEVSPASRVRIAFDGKVMPALRATKTSSDRPRAFAAARLAGKNPKGTDAIAGTGGASGADGADGADGTGEGEGSTRRAAAGARVISFRFTPGVVADDLRSAVGGRPDGLVLECYGAGNAPVERPGMAEALREICAAMPVVAITQCATGGVELGRYATGHALAEAGAIDGADLTLEAALAKLAYLLDLGVEGARLRELMPTNLLGECSPAV